MNSSRRAILQAAAIIGFPVFILFSYNYAPITLGLGEQTVKKIDPNTPITAQAPTKTSFQSNASISSTEKEGIIADLLNKPYKTPSDTSQKPAKTRPRLPLSAEKEQHVSQRILLIGDSETGGLIYPLNDYCVMNGHKLEAVFTWFSASILNFGYSNKVDELLETYKPTFVIFVVGLNEMYVTDLERRAEAAALFRKKLGDTPYLWVGPANFTPDKGINKVFEQSADPGCFVFSKDLEIPRGGDHRHPNTEGYKIWMDYIASYIQSNHAYPFNFLPPERTNFKLQGRVILANAAKDKGY
ncbi:MAG: hypothetical protein K9I25_01080 [Crocinitomicaceae bacterium]|nr:hypothetical protein [Crocinitomicaceae bacterium]